MRPNGRQVQQGNVAHYNAVGAVHPGRSVFDLSYEKKLTCDMGQLIPVLCDEMVPGDVFEVANQAVVRFQPLVSPVLHEINLYVHYFFVPYRLLWEDWEDFITGGVDGDDASVLPRWTPVSNAVGTLWDYLGMPTGVTPLGALPMTFPRDAYNLVYNEYYRDETLINEVALTDEAIKYRAWEKDYFTSSLPWQQRGTSPSLPIAGTTSAVWPSSVFVVGSPAASIGPNSNAAGDHVLRVSTSQAYADNVRGAFNANTVDLSTATTFDVADLRTVVQIQRWMERNARAGVRYTEFLRSHFDVAPRDDRLQRPEYIGGTKAPIIISEVLQTSQSDATPQGTLAGHGITVTSDFVGKYRAQEFGLMIGIMSIMPRSAYQQGVNRQWLRESRYDFYFPEFSNLSEQAIIRAEVYANGVANDNQTVFGYQGRYDEMRTKSSMVVGQMRTTFDYWHLGRIFTAAPELNKSFIECIPDKRIFAVETDPGLIVSFGNIIKAIRPMPVIAEPGLIDHV